MTVMEYLNKLTHEFAASGSASPRRDAELILAQTLNCEPHQIYSIRDNDQAQLDPAHEEQIGQLADRRKSGESIAYILGYRDFFKSRFQVGPGVLVPRPETELIVELALKKSCSHSLRILDLGCGSGCIGLSLLLELPDSTLTAVEMSPQAMDFARENAQNLNLMNRVEWFLGKAGSFGQENPPETFDLIVANPPYIDPIDPEVEPGVRLFEPAEALFAKDGGLAAIKEFSRCALAQLRPGGVYLFEFGRRQRRELDAWLNSQWPRQLEICFLKDHSGFDRICRVQKRE